ncbi:SDR family NAD(P)-dependent oxidoreductase [Chelatococcus sp. GCM10030263]|uniref:SDR family NAD(P)-dependent oxidoreductase n=1 Tax=Chelatococcus sp. GCM10030263 TaxID=3273387 RepID=UPI00360B51A2
MMKDLAGKRVLITGSSTGIGAAAAKGFAEVGARVVVHGNASREAAEAVAADIRKTGGEAHLVFGDVSRTSEAHRVVQEAVAALGGLDVLVNNAGALIRRSPLAEVEDELFDAVMDLNVRSVVMATQAAIPHLRQAGGGSVIHTSSIAARHGGGPGSVLYGAAKAAVSNITRNMAKEFARENIRVNAVAPGVILTPFHERFSTAEQLEAMRQTVPMGRLAAPEECVGAFLFLASPAMSGYVTGQVIEVNGGQLMP